MIDKHPQEGVYMEWDGEPIGGDICPAPMLTDREPSRVSCVLGPDGEPLVASIPRRVIGFQRKQRA